MQMHPENDTYKKCPTCGFCKPVKEPSMISMKELNPHNYPTTPEIDANLAILFQRINSIRSDWGKPMLITSGLRSQSDQQRINPKATKSNHLIGAACDVSDPNLELTKWLKENESQRLIDVKFWCEEGNSNWVHFQIYPPKSGKIWFNP